MEHPVIPAEVAEKLLDNDSSLSVLNIDGARFLARLVTISNEGTTAEFEIVARIAE